jgi:TRAP-type C4-dicarboxylate transport system permease large subunit
MTDHQMNYIARAALPMFGIMVLMVLILIIFPELATWLPDNMRTRPG